MKNTIAYELKNGSQSIILMTGRKLTNAAKKELFNAKVKEHNLPASTKMRAVYERKR